MYQVITTAQSLNVQQNVTLYIVFHLSQKRHRNDKTFSYSENTSIWMLESLDDAVQEKSNADGTHLRAISFKPHGGRNGE
jgi:hypothetical protein